MNKAQKKQLEILIEVDRICRKHNIRYYLVGGTLLGAIRHKGFIPWDDDIDIAMVRKDYERFKEIALQEMNKKYFYQDLDTDPYYGNTYAKIRINNTKYIEKVNSNNKAHCGIFIDIFPIDYYNEKYKFTFKRILFYRMMLLLKTKTKIDANTLVKKIELLILKIAKTFYTKEKLIKKINQLINKCSQGTSNMISYSTNYFNKTHYLEKWYDEVIDLEFENHKFMGTKYYDEYLTYVYGDYMELPPIEKRVTHSVVEIEYDD